MHGPLLAHGDFGPRLWKRTFLLLRNSHQGTGAVPDLVPLGCPLTPRGYWSGATVTACLVAFFTFIQCRVPHCLSAVAAGAGPRNRHPHFPPLNRISGLTTPRPPAGIQPRPHQTSRFVQLQYENASNWKSKIHFVSFSRLPNCFSVWWQGIGWLGVGWTPLLRTLTDAKADTQPEDTQW